MEIRLANNGDIDQLIKMRWDFTLEDYPEMGDGVEYSSFEKECRGFLETAMDSRQWFIWIGEINGEIVSHIYIELINKVPRPGRVTNPFAYMTNVFTVPEYRGKGTGSKLLSLVNEWAEEKKFEFIIVWPSDASVEFYGRNGYTLCKEPMEKHF
ncbi:GNAT family N-acetyltransferase [Mesobacillus boroniphilus]|uniref:GNAT family N-acetyltransferase n=1 Tax=Mesobacillus boroniphilus TaxID=308892 RepID=A0A944CKV2_9BACI|nr:GNAT family N-acetyltransferase [Mesobacillus boroniphilus]MBS8263628.1 GNAT family N-acetyltransferase [Mesobacillus boroniphilus]